MGSGILGTNILAGHGFFGFDPTPNTSLVNTVRGASSALSSGQNYNGWAPDTNASTASAAPRQVSGGGVDDGNVNASGSGTVLGNEILANGLTTAQNNALYDSQLGDLNSLLGRTDTGLNQGLESLNASYGNTVNQQNAQKDQALQDYSDKRVATNKDKLKAYDNINSNANAGYRSLAQIIGRGSGTGSSAFQELLPNAIGKEMSGNRTDVNQTYAANMGNIDTAQKKTENSFAQILQDLANQRADQERNLRTGVENQRQSILSQQQQLQAQRGNIGGVQSLQPQIEQSRNTVEGFFNQFKPTYNAQPATIAAPDLSNYQVDRATVNAQQQGGDASNPYADILRKKLQEQSGGF